MSILFVVHQNFSHSINCVFFFPSQQKEPVTFPNPSSLILFSSSFLHPTSSVHILLTTATFSQWHHGWSLLITVFSSWGTVFFFFLILERLGSLNLHYELIELKGNWCQTNVCSCSVTRRADVMSVYPTVLLDGSKKKKCSLKNRPSEDLLRWCNSCSGLEDRVASFLSWTSWPLNRSVHLSCNIPSQMKSSSLSTVWSPTAQL